jgi:hypothetical protein
MENPRAYLAAEVLTEGNTVSCDFLYLFKLLTGFERYHIGLLADICVSAAMKLKS